MTQNNLGTALGTLGERESGTARLEEAVAAYRAALEERTRERVPLDWAMTQNNLGNALQRSGSGRAGRRGSRRRSRPTARRWRNGRANACRSMGDDAEQSRRCAPNARERESGTARLEEAVAAFRAALEERTRERVPLDWAMTQNNLGAALRTLGERESGTARLEEAVAAYRAALEERTRERVPLDWARHKTISATRSERSGRGRRDGAVRGGGRGLSRRAGGIDARSGSARLGGDAEQSRQRAPDARGAGERDGAARGGGRGLPGGAGGMDARAGSAPMGE